MDSRRLGGTCYRHCKPLKRGCMLKAPASMSTTQLTTAQLRLLIGKLNNGPRAQEISADADLFAAGLIDSLSVVQLVTILERHYKIEFNFQDIQFEKFRSLDTLAKMLHETYKIQ